MSKNTLFATYSLGNAVCVDIAVKQQAEELITALIEQKRHNYDMADKKEQKKLLNSRRFYLYSLEYEEVVVFGTQETNLKSLFIDLALANKYFSWGPKGKMVGDRCIVDRLTHQSQEWFMGKKESGMPLYSVKCDGEKREFIAADKAAEQKAAVTLTPSSILARRRQGATTVLSSVYPTKAPEETETQKDKREAAEKEAKEAVATPLPVVAPPVVIPTVATPPTGMTVEEELAMFKAENAALKAKEAKKELKLQKAAPIAPPAVANGVTTATVQ